MLFRRVLCRTSIVSPSRRETTGAVKSNASTAEKEEMKKPKVDTERISSLRLKSASNPHPSTPNNEAENTVQERVSVHNLSANPAPSAEIHNAMHENAWQLSRNSCF